MLDELGGFDAGFRLYGEDIDLQYRAAQAGWERWYVPAAVVRHEYAAVTDKRFLTRHTLWHARAMPRFVRKHPARAATLRWEPARAFAATSRPPSACNAGLPRGAPPRARSRPPRPGRLSPAEQRCPSTRFALRCGLRRLRRPRPRCA